jgi:hypothetical protein
MDDADKTAERIEAEEAEAIAKIREAARIDPGIPGECDTCGEWSGRLIKGMCAPCRDRYGER